MAGFQTKIWRILKSPQFFAFILLLFFVESAWVAISAAYPMVFDENVHFGVIQLYAHQWSPFFPAHATYTEPFGALVSDPSILYRWLMSFPYRLISAITSDRTMQVIDLRFLNILLFGSGLVLFRRLLLKTRVSPAVINAALLLFVLIPIVPLLAGQINYDNMLFPVTALALLIGASLNHKLTHGELPIGGIFWLLTVCLLGSLVQFEFLPLFGGIMLWLVWRLIHESRRGRVRPLADARKGWSGTSWRRKLLVGLPFVIALSLFGYMYGSNLARYHSLLPQCDQVLTVQKCSGSSAWVRAQEALAAKHAVNTNPVLFAFSWTYRMFIAMFYTSSGGADPQAAWYLSINPLPLVFITALSVFVIGTLLIIKFGHALFRDYEYLSFLLFVCLFYAVTLGLYNYRDYLHYGQKFAINGRYLLPVVLPCMVAIALAFRQLLQRRSHLKGALFAAVLLLFLQGGGALTYITVSNQAWYWPNHGVARLNRTAQAVIRPLMLIKTPIRSLR